eukprot:748776-Prymnesium_polylepis.1
MRRSHNHGRDTEALRFDCRSTSPTSRPRQPRARPTSHSATRRPSAHAALGQPVHQRLLCRRV